MADLSVGRDEFERLYKTVNGNGQPGMRQDLETALRLVSESQLRITECEARMESFAKFERSTLKHQWYMRGAAAVLVLFVGFIGWTIETGIKELQPVLKIIIEDHIRLHPEDSGKLPKIGQDSSEYSIIRDTVSESSRQEN